MTAPWLPHPDDSARERRAKRRHFLWRRGVVGAGVSTAILWACVMTAWSGDDRLLRHLAGALLVFPLGGYGWAYWVWRDLERQADGG